VFLAVVLLGPAVAAAVAELLHLLVIVLVAVAAAGLAAFVAWRLRRGRQDAPRQVQRITPAPPRPSPLRSEPRQAIEAPQQMHLHFHGASAEDVAAIIAQQALPEPDVNRPDPRTPYNRSGGARGTRR
jgi:hypothetical protein